MRVVFACAGTGGHVNPAIAIARIILKQNKDAKFLFIGTKTGIENKLVEVNYMKISWIKNENDNKNFQIAERLGMDVYRLKNPEQVDETMKEILKQDCNTIILSNEMAGFSEDIIKKYGDNKDVNIIISPRK